MMLETITPETCAKCLDGTCNQECDMEKSLGCGDYVPVSKVQFSVKDKVSAFYARSHYYGEEIR